MRQYEATYRKEGAEPWTTTINAADDVEAGLIARTKCPDKDCFRTGTMEIRVLAPGRQEYVCGFARRRSGRDEYNGAVLLLRKERPAWQRGLLNGVGGRVEEGEGPDAAMAREWAEETGSEPAMLWRYFATAKFVSGAEVHFFEADVDDLAGLPDTGDRNDVGEAFEWYALNVALQQPDLVSNLRWLLPLAFSEPVRMVVLASEAC